VARDPLSTSLALASALAWVILFTTGAHGVVVGAGLAACGSVALLRGRREAATLAFMTAVASALIAVAPLVRLWPAPLLLALSAVLGVSRFRANWLERGDCGGRVIPWIVAVAVLSAGGLVAWWAVARPSPADMPRLPVELHPALLTVGLVAWAALNAAAEELYFRGALQHALVRTLGRGGVVVQAVAFGFMHYHGFPRGGSGVVLATIFGLMTGALRSRAGGLLAPWIAHLAADLTIVLILHMASR
jgi:CAAX protease family protein